MSTAELVVGSAVSVVVAVFVIALRVITHRARQQVPAATVADAGERWTVGRGRARFIGKVDAFHRVALAAAFTGITVMGLCVVGMLVLGIALVALR